DQTVFLLLYSRRTNTTPPYLSSLSLHAALPISQRPGTAHPARARRRREAPQRQARRGRARMADVARGRDRTDRERDVARAAREPRARDGAPTDGRRHLGADTGQRLAAAGPPCRTVEAAGQRAESDPWVPRSGREAPEQSSHPRNEMRRAFPCGGCPRGYNPSGFAPSRQRGG